MRSPSVALLAAVLVLVLAGCGPREEVDIAAAAPPLFENLGDHTHPITTASPQAQRYFDQGLAFTYGFNHDAAIRSFAEAARLDPECAMCFWGIALAHGPNINAPMGPEAEAAAVEALETARTLAPDVSARERAYIEALEVRYSRNGETERAALDRAYAEAMRKLHQSDLQDTDAAALFAESLMVLYPWDYWKEDGTPREYTEELVATLEGVLEQDPNHIGAIHFYIHAMEEFHPEKAEKPADRLVDLAPDAGHLVHMPSHIYWRVGRYDDAVEVNRQAIKADERFFEWCGRSGIYSALYYPHNVHFLWAGAMMEGRSDLALVEGRRLASLIEPALIDELPLVEEFVASPLFTLVRFGRADALLGELKPPEERGFLTGIWHYARGLAHVELGAVDEAAGEREALAALAERPDLHEQPFFVGTAGDRLRIALRHLEGRIAAARGDVDGAVSALEEGVRLQAALPYTEPPPWYFPMRQILGAVLLEAGRAAEAEAVYRADLEAYPLNGWSLYGLERSLREQGREGQAVLVEQAFRKAWARADVPGRLAL
jgi:tetratricopeptide (TPR) repeat protein